MGQCLKIKKIWNLVASKPENHNLTRTTAKKTNIKLNRRQRKKKHFLFADTKLQIDQTNRTIVTKFNKPLTI